MANYFCPLRVDPSPFPSLIHQKGNYGLSRAATTATFLDASCIWGIPKFDQRAAPVLDSLSVNGLILLQSLRSIKNKLFQTNDVILRNIHYPFKKLKEKHIYSRYIHIFSKFYVKILVFYFEKYATHYFPITIRYLFSLKLNNSCILKIFIFFKIRKLLLNFLLNI